MLHGSTPTQALNYVEIVSCITVLGSMCHLKNLKCSCNRQSLWHETTTWMRHWMNISGVVINQYDQHNLLLKNFFVCIKCINALQ